MKPHTAVLETEVLAAFAPVQLHTVFDGTVGAGGHAAALLQSHPEIERYIACDRDPAAHAIATERLRAWGKKVEFVHSSYSDLSTILREKQIPTIDGFLIDVGLSSMQLDVAERGFSFRYPEAPLDMRMNPDAPHTAADLVNRLPERDLEKIFREYGEEHRARAAARAVVSTRKKRPIRTVGDLLHVLEPVLRKGKLHFATLVFQALRIAVNDELKELESGLSAAVEHLSVGGRLAVISFHSLEDRIAKNFLRDRAKSDELQLVTKKPIMPTHIETRQNPRSRSAKLRVAEKIGTSHA
jgi:16S rRNA (cytosine1402-N4)-methyltransferase